MKTVTWYVPDYHCANCLARIKQVLAKIDSVRLVQGQPNQHLITVEAGGPEGLAYAKRRLAEAGYPVQPRWQKQL
jgi:copper chaperone CopZ